MKQLNSTERRFPLGESATLACLLEVSVPKVGNVHRSADFDDATFYDFVVSASSLGSVFDRASDLAVGELVLESARATREAVGTNTNLGMILLFAPLAKCESDPQSEIKDVLRGLTLNDAQCVTEAIRVARPGGLGDVPSNDVRRESTDNQLGLVELMKLAEDRDTIARQYANGFREFFDIVFPIVASAFASHRSLPESLVYAHLKIIAEIPDTLIARKCGTKVASECSTIAQRIIDELEVGSSEYHDALSDFDFWLRSDGHKRNPGTSADLLAAALFVGLRWGSLSREKLNKALERSRDKSAERME